MWKGFVVSLHISKAEAQPMIAITEAHTVPGRGIEGDRYYLGTGHFSEHHGPSYEITLIEEETIMALNEEIEDLNLEPGDARRNVVTRGVPLNHLVGREFQVGEVTLRGIRLCDPCMHIAQLTRPEVLSGLVYRGGLRAQILTDGFIRIGDVILDPDATEYTGKQISHKGVSLSPA